MRLDCWYVRSIPSKREKLTKTFAETKTLADKAIEIEQAVWDQNPPSDKTTPTQAYRTKVRFLYQNLKTPGNRTLRMKVVDGDFEVEKLVVCSSAVRLASLLISGEKS